MCVIEGCLEGWMGGATGLHGGDPSPGANRFALSIEEFLGPMFVALCMPFEGAWP